MPEEPLGQTPLLALKFDLGGLISAQKGSDCLSRFLDPESPRSREVLDLIDEALRLKDDPFFAEAYRQRCAENLNQVLDKLGLPQNLSTKEKYVHSLFFGACLGFTEFRSPDSQAMMIMPNIDLALRSYRQIYLENENDRHARIFELFVEIGYSAMRYGGQDFSSFLVNVFPIEVDEIH